MDLDKLTNHDDNSFPTLNKEPTQASDNVGNESNVSNNENATTSKRGGKAGRGRGGAKAAGVGRGGGKAGGGKGKGGSTAQSGGDKSTNGGNGTLSTAAASSSITIPAPTFPLARVSRIVKADPDIQTVSKDAIWTIAVATELFIKHLTDSLIAKTKLEKKKIASYDELAAVVESQEEFDFLQEVIPEPIQAQEAFAMRKELQEQNYQRAVGLLIDEDSDEEEEEEEEEAAGDEAAVAEEVQSTEQQQQQDESQPKEKKKSTKGKKANADGVASNSAVEDVGDTSTVSKKGGKGGRKSTSKIAEPNDGDESMQDV